MKHIVKTQEPKAFTTWKLAHPAAAYDDLNKRTNQPTKAALKQSLLQEQGYICCYCEREIDESSSHIEHFKPKDSHQPYTGLQLEYTNLHASCNLYSTKTSPNICGVRKDNTYCNKLISPLEPDCASHFSYSLDGRISPASTGDERATYTIGLLGLDDAFLCLQRKAVIEIFLDEHLTADDIELLKNSYLTKKTDGHFNPFYTTIEYLFGKHTI